MYTSFCSSPFEYRRRFSSEITIGKIKLGGSHPIRLQSMTNSITRNIQATVEQCIQIFEAGGELVRITTPTVADVGYVAEIKAELREKGYHFPLVTDVHFSPKVAEAAAQVVEKVRINPGNYSETKFDINAANKHSEWNRHLAQIEEKFIQLLSICKAHGTALRIGVNHGSLSERIMSRFGDTPQGMVESAMEFLRICQKEKFLSVVISMKASNVLVMIQAYRMLVAQMNREGMNFPLHLGVTEAGEGEDGRIKSAVGIGALLADGIGDTIRVSLTEDPELEIPVAKKLVNYFEQRTNTNFGMEGNNLEVDPFQYSRRKTKETGNIGGNFLPVVVGSFRKIKTLEEQVAEIGWNLDSKTSSWSFTDQAADFIYLDEIPGSFNVPTEKSILLPFKKWNEKKLGSNIFPLFSTEEVRNLKNLSQPNFIIARLQDLNSLAEIDASNSVLIFESIRENPVAEMRACFAFLQKQQLSIPVILKKTYNETDMEQFQIKASCDMGALLADGLGDGIWIENLASSLEKEVNATAFGILQATRTRISKTEYISCPSCGRTLFDLQATCAKIRERTNHLKGLKIGIMGCIVNGPGEMADADYGYVGAGPGRITLYKSKEVVKKNLNENEAVEELINLIKENGDWLEPI